MTSRPFLRKNHNFKRGLIDKWCISNASLDNTLLVSKFIEIIIAQILWTFKEFRLFPFIESDYFTIFVYW